MDYSQSLDLYCERTDALFWSEPFNAVSNGAFAIAAIALVMRARATQHAVPWDIALLAGLIALIGLGSFAFHTFGTVGTSLLDVLFIEIYIYVFLARFLQRVGGLNVVWTFAGLVVFGLFERAVTGLFEPGSLNGSYRYLPALVALAGMSIHVYRTQPAMASPLVTAMGLLCVSLGFRTIDMAVCDLNPLGTHFLWHIINALVLYCAAVALLRFEPRAVVDRRPI